jgi:hypothetical protein
MLYYMIKYLLHFTRDYLKTYALGTSYEGFTNIRVCMSENRTKVQQKR